MPRNPWNDWVDNITRILADELEISLEKAERFLETHPFEIAQEWACNSSAETVAGKIANMSEIIDKTLPDRLLNIPMRVRDTNGGDHHIVMQCTYREQQEGAHIDLARERVEGKGLKVQSVRETFYSPQSFESKIRRALKLPPETRFEREFHNPLIKFRSEYTAIMVADREVFYYHNQDDFNLIHYQVKRGADTHSSVDLSGKSQSDINEITELKLQLTEERHRFFLLQGDITPCMSDPVNLSLRNCSAAIDELEDRIDILS